MATTEGAPDGARSDPTGASPTRTVDLVVEGPITPADIPVLCARARALMDRGDVGLVVCDVRALGAADGVVVDALARLQLAARRRGCRVALRHASIDLLGLLALAGLSDIVPLAPEQDGR
ncbi:MAG TPA: STAS domain-containing protein [Acidimicrobiales bacterium]|nr:STAS domain-containing protein [Acidimicrobiales bacterium]